MKAAKAPKTTGAKKSPRIPQKSIPAGKKVSEHLDGSKVKIKPFLPKGGVKFFEKLG